MSDSSDFRELISGTRRDWQARLMRGGLRVPESLYAAAVMVRNQLYDRRILPVRSLTVPVIAVGNLTVGGTGKSPVVLWIARWLTSLGIRPVVVSRGYGATAGALNDEALEMRMLAPDIPHVQDPRRHRAAVRALAEFHADAVVLDDGFQHRQLARDLDIVLLDATNPFGYEHLLPRGFLREPLRSLRRANLVVLTRADCASAETQERVRSVIRQYAPAADYAEAILKPCVWRDVQRATFPVASWSQARVFGFAAIGNPENFRRTLESLGCRLTGFRTFPDHHHFRSADWEGLVAEARGTSADVLVCTGKDLVKIPPEWAEQFPLRALMTEIQFRLGQEQVERALIQVTSAAR